MADVPDTIQVTEEPIDLPVAELLTGRGFITGKSGSGKSVREGTIVYTEGEGRKPIEQVRAGDRVLSLNRETYKQEFREVLATLEHESEELLRIRLEDGTEVVGTADHSFLTVEDLEIVPIRGDQVEEGTWMPLARSLPSANQVSMIDLGEYVAESNDIDIDADTIRSGQKRDARYLELDFAIGKVLGLYLAEGSFDTRLTVQIANRDEGIRTFLGNHGFKVYETSCNRSFRPFGRFIEDEFGRGADSKSIPGWVFDAPMAFKAGILSGYIDGDGTVHNTVSAMSKSPALIRGLQELLRQFGISSTVREKFTVYKGDKRRYLRISVDAYCLPELGEILELSASAKAVKLEEVIEAISTGESYNSKDMVPAFGTVLNDAAREQEWTHRNSLRRAQASSVHVITRQAKADRTTYNRYLEELDVGGASKRFGQSDILWKRVVDVEPLEERETVYDLDVRYNDNFIADGVFVHNSNSASVLAEELLEIGLPLLIVDTDGEYYGLQERYQILHATPDESGDMQVGVEDADRLAELALDGNVPIILDLSSYVDPEEGEALIRKVLHELFRLEDSRRKPFLLIVEEIHEYLPEQGAHGQLGDLLIQIAKRGRKRGLGLCGISQRPAAVDKDFITQCDWLVWHRLTWGNDTRVVKQILGSDAATTVQNLKDGEGLLMTDWDDATRRVKFRRKRTHDAGATPDLADVAGGPSEAVEVEVLEAIDTKPVGNDPSPATLEAKQRRIDRLQRRVEELEAELEQAHDTPQPPTPAPAPPEPQLEEVGPIARGLSELGSLAAYLTKTTRHRASITVAQLRQRFH